MEVLLIDDHPMLNVGIISILENTGLFTVCGQAASLEQAMNTIEESETLPSLIILDLLLGEDNGLDFLPMLEKFCCNKKIPKPPVLVCSALGDSFKVHSALKLGASGFLSKTGGKAELLDAIGAVLSGKTYISSELNIKLGEKTPLYAKFSKRETNVIDLIKQNKTNKQIAGLLSLNLRTVENYISRIYFKTGFSCREEVHKL